MADIHIERSHSLSPNALKARLTEMEGKLADKYGVRLTWRGDAADVKGTGVTGSIAILAGAVVVDLKLGMFVRPFANKIQETMERQLEKALGQSA
jgi:putative polyhydroxyalkanoate system protein